MTRRERLENKLEKREEWAGKAEKRSTERFDAAHRATEGIPFGQPILVGHHSEGRHRATLARSDNQMRKGCEEADLAKHHASKADGLATQLDSSIFSDDHDAIEQLEARIAEREAERDRWKAYNASCRKGEPDASLLDEHQRKNIESTARVCPAFIGKKGQAPSYILTNLGGVIRNDKKRIEQIKCRVRNAQIAADAGGVFITKPDATYGYCRVVFAEKPDWSILKALKAADFTWGSGHWHGKHDSLPAEVLALNA